MGIIVFGALLVGLLCGAVILTIVVLLFLLIRRRTGKGKSLYFVLLCLAGITLWGAGSILFPYNPPGTSPSAESLEYVLKRAFIIGMTPSGSVLGLLSAFFKSN
jgi:energy-converting hydrogenase Eha subunit G